MRKSILYIFIFVIGVASSCHSSEETKADITPTPEQQVKQRDSLVKSDKERADSMLKAMKEKLKVQ